VAAAAEPRPAELPLPGGRKDATVRVHPLLSGRTLGPKAWFLREDGRLAWRKALGIGIPKDRWLTVPIISFLVEHPGAGPVLIDTGFHGSVAASPRANLGRVASFTFKGIEMKPEQAVAAQLREKGIQPSSVEVVVITHLHVDHASAIADFPNATFVFSTAEWEAATTQGQLHGYNKRQFDHAFDYRTLDFDGPDAAGFSGFGRTFDLFGDGSVRLAFTPGHSLGHLSVILRLKGGEILVAGDAMYMTRTLTDHHLPYRLEDEHLFRRSLREIELYARETPDAVIVPGHDWEAWQALDAVYE
jgi:glyoxylase-like metal-dependent hydrolase (beta-lactamase superfamily II)